MFLVCLLAALMQLAVSTTDDDTSVDIARKVWSICYPNGSCSCGSSVGNVVICDDNVRIQPCFCMYFDLEKNATMLGNCPLMTTDIYIGTSTLCGDILSMILQFLMRMYVADRQRE